jgi:UPF0755 protein
VAKKLGCLLLLVVIAFGLAAVWVLQGVRPLPRGEKVRLRVQSGEGLAFTLERLEKLGVIRSARALAVYNWVYGGPKFVGQGTFEFAPGMTADQVIAALRAPLRQMVRIPETNWAARTANILERYGVCAAEEYLAEVRSLDRYRKEVAFPLPEKGTLEGYLFPDTYDLPPLLGAREVVLRQLKAFERKVWSALNEPKDLHRLVTVASMVELEVARDDERPIVAGVIENRLKLGMRLQIDATVLYALGEWRALTRKDLSDTDSPYNTYRQGGLPPGPICSPSFKSVEAALRPSEHGYLYYVALPDGRHLFSSTLRDHTANIRKRKEALAAAQR